MSALITDEIWEHFPRGGPEFTLLLALGREAKDDGTVEIRDDAEIMRMSRLNLHAYVRALSILQTHGWIELRNPYDPEAHEYRIPFLR